MKGLRVTKNVKEINCEEIWGEFEPKKTFRDTVTHKLCDTNTSLHMK